MHYVAVDGVIEVDEFVGDGTTTNFSTSLSIINEDATTVFVSGVYQSKLTYQTTGNVVSFTTAPPNGANIEIVHVKALALSGFNKNNFVGTGSQTAFTLNTTVNEENMTFVFLEGIYQDKSTYSISGTTLTFATAPQSGYNIEVMVLGAISASTNALYTDTFTGDGSTTAYALGITPVDLNAIEVYLNGLYQNVSTLTLSANTVTFATAPPSGVIIEIRSVGFLNSGGTLSPATLIGGTGISVVTNSPNNFTISNTLIDVYVSWATPTGQSLTYTTPSPQSTGPFQAGSTFPSTTFTVTAGATNILSGTAVLTGLPTGISVTSQSYNNNNVNNTLTITLGGVYPSANATNVGIIVSGLTSTLVLLADYLVVAGAGGGGKTYYGGGGGGAGGLRTSYGSTSGGGASSENSFTIDLATNYAITVGAGGAGMSNGSNSSIVAASITDVICTGGGYGGNGTSAPQDGGPGGSGGGGATGVNGPSYGENYFGGAGTANEGFDGARNAGNSTPTVLAGGGGGASQTPSVAYYANPGGNGLAVNILNATNAATENVGQVSGTDVYYAGGGAGGGRPGSGSSGGTGGGANGVSNNNVGNNGTPNTGGGGSGASSTQTNNMSGGAGGSGVVIIRYPSSLTLSNPGGGLTPSTYTESTKKVTVFKSGTGNIQFN